MLLIDGDILVYSVGFICESRWYEVLDPHTMITTVYQSKRDIKKAHPLIDIEYIKMEREVQSEGFAAKIVDSMIKGYLKRLGKTKYKVFLTHKDINENFRKKLDPAYKENRKGLIKPVRYQFIRDYLVDKHGAEIAKGHEADDSLGIHQTEDTIIVSKDKDLLQVPGLHYNTMNETLTNATKHGKLKLWRDKAGKARLKGTGFKWFCAQCLLGDAVDNIKGIDRVGPVKTYESLRGCKSNKSAWAKVKGVYKQKERDDLLLNAQLLWILREEGDYFDEEKV